MAEAAPAPREREFAVVAEVRSEPARALVYEHGWQSWSPSGLYPATGTSPRPRRPEWQTAAFRPHRPAPPTGFQGEGLLAVVPADGPVRLWYAPDPWRDVASIRALALDDRVVVSSDAAVAEHAAPTLDEALADVAQGLAAKGGVEAVPALGPGWCSWYCYWGNVTEDDVLANLAASDRLGLDIRVVQIDDGYQADIGDWLDRSARFGPLDDLAARITDTGREAGLWTAPFLVGAHSTLARDHPDWLVAGAVALPHHWGQRVGVLDVTNPQAAEHLAGVYRRLRAWGFTYHKVDFCYAGALEGGRAADCTGLDAYAQGLEIIRDAVGPAATILGCGAPLLPAIGRVDAMRVSPDIDPSYDATDGDLSQPGQRSAVTAGQARRWMHARLWVNDPDCIIVRPQVEERARWASHLQQCGGLMVSSDPLDALDDEGLAWTRQLLRPSATDPPAAGLAGPPQA